MAAKVEQASEIKIKLSVVKGPHSGRVFQLNKSVFTIGRGPENDVVLINDPQISRSHAQISVVDRDIEISNLSDKNAIFVLGESVKRWKIANNSNFTIGDSEINVEYDLGPAPEPVKQSKPMDKVADVVPIKAKAAVPSAPTTRALPATKNAALEARGPQAMSRPATTRPNQKPALARPAPQAYAASARLQPNPNAPADDSLMASPNFKIYLIGAIILGTIYFYFSTPNKNSRAKKITSTLRYEDEVNTRMVSQKEIERESEREARSKERSRSPQAFRIEESLVRGMRDFQLGNYTRAQEFFQLVLNLDPDHALARRYHYLSKVRFDEVLQEKLMLGESYFKKHNFRMCESMFRQVMDMLNGKNNDQKLLLATKKARECELATEGIR
ncbi:MAG: FHA domain-containing protein [Bdellovibrionota bacterium]